MIAPGKRECWCAFLGWIGKIPGRRQVANLFQCIVIQLKQMKSIIIFNWLF